MIAHVPGTDRTADVAVPRPRTGEPGAAPRATPPPPRRATDAADPILVAARLEDGAAALSWVGRLALLVAVGLVVVVLL